MAGTTDWVIGSVKDLNASMTIDAALGSIQGDRYLYHTSSPLSILGGMAAAMTAAGVADAAAVLTRDRRVKLSSSGTFSVTWGADTTLRDLLGFTANLAGAATYVATNVSPLLWSPLKPLQFELSPRGTLGIERPLAYYAMSPSTGTAFVARHGERIDQVFTCASVDIARVFTSDEAGGEFVRWFNTVAANGYQFFVYPGVTETVGSTTEATLTGGLGSYVWVPSGRAPSWEYTRSRGFTWTDFLADVRIPCRVATEYGT